MMEEKIDLRFILEFLILDRLKPKRWDLVSKPFFWDEQIANKLRTNSK